MMVSGPGAWSIGAYFMVGAYDAHLTTEEPYADL